MLSRGWPTAEALGEVRGLGDGDYLTSQSHVPHVSNPYVEYRSLNHGSAEFE
jgi:hypothetical protein